MEGILESDGASVGDSDGSVEHGHRQQVVVHTSEAGLYPPKESLPGKQILSRLKFD